MPSFPYIYGIKFALQCTLTKVWVEGEFESFVYGLNWNILLQNTPPSRIHMELKLLVLNVPYSKPCQKFGLDVDFNPLSLG